MATFFKNLSPYTVSLIFVLILVFSFTLRVYNLDKNPAGFFCDEASIGYNAYSILKTGKDEWGHAFPLFFEAFGEYKNPLDIYATVPFIARFGLNEFATRLPSVFFNILTGVVLFFIGRKLKNSALGLFLMLVYAITPWSIHMSRINWEGQQILLLFTALSFLLLLQYLQDKKSRSLFLFSVISAFCIYTYSPARITAPLFFLTSLSYFLYKNRTRWYNFVFCLIIFIVLLVPFGYRFHQEGLARWQQVSMFQDKKKNPLKKFTTSYLLHFSPDYLFFKGDIGMAGQFVTRHSVRGEGELYIWQLPLIILGLFYVYKKKRAFFWPLAFFLFIYPLPSSLTSDVPPQATRSIAGIIAFTLLSGIGLIPVAEYFQRKKRFWQLSFIAVFIFIVSILFGKYIYHFQKYPLYSSDFWGWQYGPHEIISYFKDHRSEYKDLYMTGSFNAPEIFLKFYDPDNLCKNCHIGGLNDVDQTKKQLFVLSEEEYLSLSAHQKAQFSIKKVILYPDSSAAFYIGEFIPRSF